MANKLHLSNVADASYSSVANGVPYRLALCRRMIADKSIVPLSTYYEADEADESLDGFCLRCRDSLILYMSNVQRPRFKW